MKSLAHAERSGHGGLTNGLSGHDALGSDRGRLVRLARAHRLRLFYVPLVSVCAGIALTALGAERITSTTESQGTRFTLAFRGQPLMAYEFSPSKFKPYVKELYTIKGQNVLRDSPHDHLHHHALMYGIKVEGVNFWEEVSGCGVERVVRTDEPVSSLSPGGLPQAIIQQDLVWVAPADAFLPLSNTPSLLIEHRTLTLTVDEKTQEVALLWNSQFRVGTKTNTVVLTGANYHGLGMRFPAEMDPVAVHFTPEGRPDLAQSRQDNTVFPWEAVSFDLPGKPATIALFGLSKNERGYPRFFAMRTPFAYLSATQALDTQPLVRRAGEPFALTYLVTLYPEVKTTGALNTRASQFESTGY